MEFCDKCGIPKTGNNPFNDHNECAFCRNWHLYRTKSKGDFKPIADEMIKTGQGKRFDCIVGISGGRDSTYTLYKLSRNYGLRCAAVFVENAFVPRQTIENVKTVTDKLNVKLFRSKIPFDFHTKFAREMVTYWKKTHKPLFANLACAPCKLFTREIFKLADSMDIDSIVYGGNPHEFFYAGPADTSIIRRGRFTFIAMLQDTVARIIKGSRLLFAHTELVKYLPMIIKASLMYCNQYSPYLKLRYPRIRSYDFFHHYDWDETEMESILADLGWQLPPGCVSTWRADCEFAEVKNYMFTKSVGISHVHSLYSNLARENKLSREEAIKRSKREAFSEERMKCALEKISLESLENDC